MWKIVEKRIRAKIEGRYGKKEGNRDRLGKWEWWRRKGKR